jgi:hypothetical protein
MRCSVRLSSLPHQLGQIINQSVQFNSIDSFASIVELEDLPCLIEHIIVQPNVVNLFQNFTACLPCLFDIDLVLLCLGLPPLVDGGLYLGHLVCSPRPN